jgi:hypothetical protein
MAIQQVSSTFQPFQLFTLSTLPPAGRGGNIFSNHWKMREKFFQSLEKTGGFFQPLENIFPIIGKFAAGFPAIGKKFSNRWKIRRRPGLRTGSRCP